MNEVEVRVRVRDDTRPGFASARRTAEREGAATGRAFGGRFRAALQPVVALGQALGSALASAASSGPVLATALMLTAAAAQQLAGAGLVLPGVLLATAAAGGTLMVAMTGVTDALTGDEKAMASLSGEARDFARSVRGLKGTWDDLRKSVQDKFFAGLAEDVRSLAKVYLPELKRGMGGVATELNLMARNAASALMKPESVDAVNKVFSNTAKFIENARNSLGNFIAGFLKLGAIGSEYLPQLGAWIDRIAQRFNDWTSNDPDAIRRMIDGGVQAFKDLWAIAGNVYDTVMALATGLSGGEGGDGFIASIRGMTETLAAFANDPAVQMVLTVIGTLIGLLIDSLPIWGPVALGIGLVVGAIKLWTLAQTLLNIALTANPIGLIVVAIGLLVSALIYAWNNSETFRAIVLGALDAIVAAWNWCVEAFWAGVDAVAGAWNWLTSTIGGAVAWIRGALSTMWDGLVAGAKGAANGAISVLNGLINALNGVVWGMNLVNPFSDIPYIPHVPYLARGGIASGLAVVGEKGRELVQLPSGSRVMPHGDTERALAGAGGSSGGTGGGVMEMRIAAGSDGAVADMIMKLIRTGKIQIRTA